MMGGLLILQTIYVVSQSCYAFIKGEAVPHESA